MKKLLFLPIAAALLSACNTTFKEDVAIDSFPSGADVYINSELVGKTPTTVELVRDGSYEVTFKKEGYKDQTMALTPTNKNAFVKFGPLVDMGYYKELPAEVDGEMLPDFLPAYPGINAFNDMAANILQADQLRKDGKITPEEHSYLMKVITKFYSQADAK